MSKTPVSNGSAVAYIRLSYVKGEGGAMGEMTLEDQLASCQGVATQRGLTIEKIYNEGQGSSAFKAGNRPQWDKMLDELEPGTTVLGWATSRISRNAEETWRDIDKRGGIVVTADGNTSEHLGGKQAMAFAGVVDEFYSLRLSTQVKEGLARSRRQGRHQGTRPMGYDKVDGALKIRLDEASVIRQVAKNIIEGSSMTAEVKRLNAEGAKTPRDKSWAATGLKRMLKNKLQMGLIELPDGELRMIADEPVLDAGTFKELQTAIAKRERKTDHMAAYNATGQKPTSLLSGIGKCAACGLGLASGRNHGYYKCSRKVDGICPGGGAGSKRQMDAYVVTILHSLCDELQEDTDRLEALAKAWGTTNDPTIEIERKRLNGEIEVSELQLKAMAEKLASNEMTVDAYAIATDAIGAKVKNLKEQLASIVVDDSPVVWVDDVRAALADRVEDVQTLDTPEAMRTKGSRGGTTPLQDAQTLLVESFIATAGGFDQARKIISTVFKSITLRPKTSKKYEFFIAADRIEYELAV